jgi:hypothetical protein
VAFHARGLEIATAGRIRARSFADGVNGRVAQLAATQLWIPLLKEYIQPTRLLLCPGVTGERDGFGVSLRESFPEIEHFKLWRHSPPAIWGGYWSGEITDADDPHRYRSTEEHIKRMNDEDAEKKRIGEELAKTHKTQWTLHSGASEWRVNLNGPRKAASSAQESFYAMKLMPLPTTPRQPGLLRSKQRETCSFNSLGCSGSKSNMLLTETGSKSARFWRPVSCRKPLRKKH